MQRMKQIEALPAWTPSAHRRGILGSAWQILVPGLSRHQPPTLANPTPTRLAAVVDAREVAPPYPRREPEMVLADMAHC